LRKEVLINQQIEKSLVESQLSNLQAQVAHLRQNMGELDFKLGDVKATHERQTLTELQDASQRLAEIENSIGPARKLLEVKSDAVGDESDDSNYKVVISRVRDGRLTSFEATEETMLSPGDVVEVKRKQRNPGSPSLWTQAVEDSPLIPSVAEGAK
jgi:hypothetical protein